MNDKLAYSIAEAAGAMSLSEWTVREMCYRGEIASRKVGRRRIIARWALDEFLGVPTPEPEPADAPAFLA